MNVLGGSDQVTLVDIADRLLDTGVVLDGEATISVADVDLIYLGLNVALTSVDRMRRVAAGEAGKPVRRPAARASGGLARYVPSGPGAMSAALHKASEDPDLHPTDPSGPRGPRVRPVRARPPVIERSEAARHGRGDSEAGSSAISRLNVDPDEVEQGLAKLVLTVVEFVRQLLERQAVRRMQSGTLTEEEVERVGLAMERLDAKMTEMAARFGLTRADLSLKLGPLGELV